MSFLYVKIKKEGGRMATSVESLQLMEIREESLQEYNATSKLLGNVKVLAI